MSQHIRLDIAPPLAEIVLNRPDKRNALSSAMWAALPELIDAAVADPEVKVVLIHGGTSGAFAAGADISEFDTIYADEATSLAASKTIHDGLHAIEHCPKPVIAAIEGACVGGGVSVALTADVRIAADSAKFGVTPAKLGLVYPLEDSRRLLETVGRSAARDILFTGRIFAASEALRVNLVDRVVGTGQAVEDAREYAMSIAANSQWSVRALKESLLRIEAGQREEDTASYEKFNEAVRGEDFQEGYRAFLEKRKAKFTFR